MGWPHSVHIKMLNKVKILRSRGPAVEETIDQLNKIV